MNWNEMEPDAFNSEVASRLRGLAALVESCDRKVKLRLSARLVWSDTEDRFETGIVAFPEFSDRLMTFTTARMLEILKSANTPEAAQIAARIEEITQRPQK